VTVHGCRNTSEYTHPLGTVAKLEQEDIKELDASLRGRLVLPDREDYEDPLNVWNGIVNNPPAAIARAEGSVDVARTVEFARDNDPEGGVRGGAHNQTGAAMVDNGLVVDLREVDDIHIDPGEQVACVGPSEMALVLERLVSSSNRRG